MFWASDFPGTEYTHGAVYMDPTSNAAYSTVSMDLRSSLDAYPFVCEKTACLEGQLSCADGSCVTGIRCDDNRDCSDNSDEKFCGMYNKSSCSVVSDLYNCADK